MHQRQGLSRHGWQGEDEGDEREKEVLGKGWIQRLGHNEAHQAGAHHLPRIGPYHTTAQHANRLAQLSTPESPALP
ncbi:hypothetical protein Q8A67_022359 [Cirrhinus molitorella]|uniref:Uncharacterized protein n=1 Tax=Cirrhinus molitorella TaxID=172907 RepID=A0AA88TC29_9TELE|nr:hypothetical protein Q8A67_022359 [Cirrhinus molitorella]